MNAVWQFNVIRVENIWGRDSLYGGRIVVSDPTLWALLWYKYFNYCNVWIGEVETEFK